jgi:hypothetical protein
MSGLLGHMVPLLTNQTENAVTRALTYLVQPDTAREAFSSLLTDACGQKIEVARVVTQQAVSKESVPDMLAFDDDGKVLGYVEAKINAGLTSAQQTQYLRRLEEQGGKFLLFVVPGARIEALGGEVRRMAEANGVTLTPWVPKSRVQVSKAPSGTTLVMTSWTTLLGAVHAACSRSNDRRALADVEQLEGLVKRFEAEGFMPLSDEELNEIRTARRLISIVNVVERTLTRAAERKITSFGGKGNTESHSWYCSGRNIYFPEAWCWAGVDLEAWARHQASPAGLRFYDNESCRAPLVKKALQRWQGSSPKRLFDGDNGIVYVPLFIKPNAEEDDVVEHLVGQLREIGDLLKAAGMPLVKT